MMSMRQGTLLAFILLSSLAAQIASGQEPESGLDRFAKALAKAQIERTFQSWNRPVEPFRVIGNVYYVGAAGVCSFLIATPAGHILLDSGFEDTVPLIRTGVRKLGFRFEDIKLLLNSHAHIDHAGGHARLKGLTGARIIMSEADSILLARGGKGDFLPLGDEFASYTPAQADRIVGDEERVALGGVTLTAHLTPGHTKGCTTWTMTVQEGREKCAVVFVGSATLLPGVRLIDNTKYPGIAADYAKTFRVLKTLPCDVFLAPHGFLFGLEEKARRLKAGAQPNPFIDAEGYRSFLDRSEQVYLRQLERERVQAAPSKPHPARRP